MFRPRGLVRMPADDDLKSRGGGIEIERVNIVQNVNRRGFRFEDFGFGQGQRPRLRIDVSPYGKNGRECFQPFQNSRIAHVAPHE